MNIFVADESGQVFASSLGNEAGVRIGDRQYFNAFRKPDQLHQFAVSESLKGKISNEWGVQVARRVNKPDGSFAGVIVASLSLDKTFESFYGSVSLRPLDLISLRDTSNRILVRYPSSESQLGKQIFGSAGVNQVSSGEAEGIVLSNSPVDGVTRITAIRKLPDYPIFAIVGLDQMSEMASWTNEKYLSISVTFFVLIVGLLLTHFIRKTSRANDMLELLSFAMNKVEESAYLADKMGRFHYVNDEACRALGYPREKLLTMTVIDVDNSADTSTAQWDDRVSQIKDARNLSIESRHRRKDGSDFPVEINTSYVEHDGRVYILGLVRDISKRKQSEQALKDSKALAQAILDSMSSEIAVLDRNGVILATNKAWQRFALENSELPGRLPPNTEVGCNYFDVCGNSPKDIAPEASLAQKGIQDVLEGKASCFTLEYACHSPTERRWFSMNVTPLDTNLGFAVVAHNNITQRKLAEEQVLLLALHDPLTHLPNRRMLQDRLSLAIANNRRNAEFSALMILDLDKFKPLNDTYGHAAGDQLLVEVAKRLVSNVREIDTVARIGGDEFVIVLGELGSGRVESIEKASRIAEKIRLELSQPYLLSANISENIEQQTNYQCSASIGITVFDGSVEATHDLMTQADFAMYLAKSDSGNSVQVFDPSNVVTH